MANRQTTKKMYTVDAACGSDVDRAKAIIQERVGLHVRLQFSVRYLPDRRTAEQRAADVKPNFVVLWLDKYNCVARTPQFEAYAGVVPARDGGHYYEEEDLVDEDFDSYYDESSE